MMLDYYRDKFDKMKQSQLDETLIKSEAEVEIEQEVVEEELIEKSVEEIDALADEVIKGRKANMKKAEDEEPEEDEKEDKEEPEEEEKDDDEKEEAPKEEKEEAPKEDEGEGEEEKPEPKEKEQPKEEPQEEQEDKPKKKEANVDKEKPEVPADEISQDGDGGNGKENENEEKEEKSVKNKKGMKKSEDIEDIVKSFTDFYQAQSDSISVLSRDVEKSINHLNYLNDSFDDSNERIEKSLSDLSSGQIQLQELLKSQAEMIGKQNELIKSLETRIDELEHKPVGRKAVLDVVEKSFNKSTYQPEEQKQLSKGEVLNKMSNLLMSGAEGITVDDIIRFESTGFLNQNVKDLLKNS